MGLPQEKAVSIMVNSFLVIDNDEQFIKDLNLELYNTKDKNGTLGKQTGDNLFKIAFFTEKEKFNRWCLGLDGYKFDEYKDKNFLYSTLRCIKGIDIISAWPEKVRNLKNTIYMTALQREDSYIVLKSVKYELQKK